ncbi:MAG: hypothetical protein ABFS32_17710 [Bacteroidota bacterium]
MLKNRIRKPKISIHNIGKPRFWLGIIIWIAMTIVLYIAFNYSRELLRFFTALSADLYTPSESEYIFYNYFFSALSMTLGLSFSLWIWSGNIQNNKVKTRLYSRLNQTNSMLVFWVMLMVVVRFGTVLIFVLYGNPGYDNHFSFKDEFWLLIALIPLIVFFQSWFNLRMVYRTGRWILYTFLICGIGSFILPHITSIDTNTVNNKYQEHYKTEFNFIDHEIMEARNNYSVNINPLTVQTLKKWYTEELYKLIKKTKLAFSKDGKVSMDTIIMEKIIIQNLKQGSEYRYMYNSIRNWQYAFPIDVYNQIKKYNLDDLETNELFYILNLEITLWNTPRLNWDHYSEYSRYERKKSRFSKYYYPVTVIRQLYEVREELISDNQYSKYHYMLPEIIWHDDLPPIQLHDGTITGYNSGHSP